jgi:hypothetical protein
MKFRDVECPVCDGFGEHTIRHDLHRNGRGRGLHVAKCRRCRGTGRI